MATINFDPSKYVTKEDVKSASEDTGEKYGPIKPGWYHVVAIGDEMKTTQKGDGEYLSVQFEIVDEGNEFEGRYVWANFMFEHPSEKAVEYSFKSYAMFCVSAGFNQPVSESHVLWNRPVRVRIVNEEWNGKTNNKIVSYRAANMTAPTQSKDVTPF